MKKLQRNFTTQEQSKRLLELGVPEWTADCFFGGYSGHPEYITIRQTEFEIEDDLLFKLNDHLTPCWSVGRLIEIAKICSKSRYALRGLFLFLDECEADECMSQVMDYFEICNYQFDFSKLEE